MTATTSPAMDTAKQETHQSQTNPPVDSSDGKQEDKMSDLNRTGRSKPDFVNVGSKERVVSVLAGALLAYWRMKKIKSGTPANVALSLASNYLFYRGLSGNCVVNTTLGRDTADDKAQQPPVDINSRLTINKPREEVYNFWRRLKNLPSIMKNLKDVKEMDDTHSHWEAHIPGGIGSVNWDAEIVKDERNEKLAWRSVPGSGLQNAGEISFKDAKGNGGTELHARINYRPPAGRLGTRVAKFLNPIAEEILKQNLLRFKQVMEGNGVPAVKEEGPEGKKS